MSELVTLIVMEDSPYKTALCENLLQNGFTPSPVNNLTDIHPLLNDASQKIATVVVMIPEEKSEFERNIRQLKRNDVAKYIPFIGIAASGSDADEVSRQPFFHIIHQPMEDKVLIHTLEAAQSDFKRYNALLCEVNTRTSAIGLIQSGSFRLQTLHQAEALTTMLSLACPEPSIVALGLSEILVNAIEHGNLDISYHMKSSLLENGLWEEEINKRLSLPEFKDKFVEIKFIRSKDKITIIVTDEGKGFDWRKFIEKDPAKNTDKHGRGIAIAIAMGFSQLSYNEKGNQVTATINL
ncbi:MAG: ATP-binding protein [Methylocystaceae bacterium]|nr:ATP-binding protein [Methylocystaceae bacterium]